MGGHVGFVIIMATTAPTWPTADLRVQRRLAAENNEKQTKTKREIKRKVLKQEREATAPAQSGQQRGMMGNEVLTPGSRLDSPALLQNHHHHPHRLPMFGF